MRIEARIVLRCGKIDAALRQKCIFKPIKLRGLLTLTSKADEMLCSQSALAGLCAMNEVRA
jgi:hypothetical protein